MTGDLGVGIIGCGNISTSYLSLGPLFKGIEIRACADIVPEAAQIRAQEYGIRHESIDDLLSADDIDIVVNLTTPDAHYAVSAGILSAGKHAYSEKPLVLSTNDGKNLLTMADERDLKVGSAPDTFLGGSHQLARKLIDDGAVGTIASGTCHVLSPGMEHWHPNPDFFFKPGGGPILDLGPYYLTNLVNLIGPAKRVAALSSAARTTRTISSEPRKGETISVETPTNIHALLEFANGATITLSASWDVWAHRHHEMELYGTEGSIYVPDPNFFGGEVILTERSEPVDLPEWDHPFGRPNQEHGTTARANYRCAGLADMALAIQEGRDYRCAIARALHVTEIMLAILASGESKDFIELTTTCERPAPLLPQEAAAMLR